MSSQDAQRLSKEGNTGLNAEVPNFKKFDKPTLLGEYALIDNDLVFHFYLTEEQKKQAGSSDYWFNTFPRVLDKTAQEYFQVGAPRLKASYTDEMGSWWMRAYGFGNVLDPDSIALGFMERLERDLKTQSDT